MELSNPLKEVMTSELILSRWNDGRASHLVKLSERMTSQEVAKPLERWMMLSGVFLKA